MPKKKVKKVKRTIKKKPKLPKLKLTQGQHLADTISKWGGSWAFIISFFVFLIIWMSLNIYLITIKWDPYPFILLNLTLSCLAAIQAPIILMSQNRTVQRDRAKAERDYIVNRKAEREIEKIQKNLQTIQGYLYKHSKK